MMMEGDSRQQLEIDINSGLAQRVREIRELMMKAPVQPHPELKDMQLVSLHPGFKQILSDMLLGYENLLRPMMVIEPKKYTCVERRAMIIDAMRESSDEA